MRNCCNIFFCIYLIIYSKLEHEQLLNPNSDFDIFLLYFVAMQLVANAVDGFAGGWNAHPISTENNVSPNQLFVLGAPARDKEMGNMIGNAAMTLFGVPSSG
jgi:hypothetical protein